MPLAEENGTIVEIGRWVLAKACQAASAWIRDGEVGDDFVVRVNLSARQLDQPDLSDQVDGLLRRTSLPADRLCLEITETALMRDAAVGLRVLSALRRVGVHLAVDDFGTGYSSLSFLKRFPLDVLKIDRSFVDGLPDDAEDMAIATTILSLAESLELSVTAEGVETAAQRDALDRPRLSARPGLPVRPADARGRAAGVPALEFGRTDQQIGRGRESSW